MALYTSQVCESPAKPQSRAPGVVAMGFREKQSSGSILLTHWVIAQTASQAETKPLTNSMCTIPTHRHHGGAPRILNWWGQQVGCCPPSLDTALREECRDYSGSSITPREGELASSSRDTTHLFLALGLWPGLLGQAQAASSPHLCTSSFAACTAPPPSSAILPLKSLLLRTTSLAPFQHPLLLAE